MCADQGFHSSCASFFDCAGLLMEVNAHERIIIRITAEYAGGRYAEAGHPAGDVLGEAARRSGAPPGASRILAGSAGIRTEALSVSFSCKA